MLSFDFKFLLDNNFNVNGCSVKETKLDASSRRNKAAVHHSVFQLNCHVITDTE